MAAALAVLGLGLRKPYNNWDVIGYTAAALSAEGCRGTGLNEATYASLRNAVDADTFTLLTQGDDYRRTVRADPASLAQQLPFYGIRVLYLRLLGALHALGAGYPQATHIVSAAFAALSVVLLALIGREAGAPPWAVPLVAACAGLVDVARLSTPDAMACFFALLTSYALLRRSMLVFVLAALLPLVRTDFLLFSLLVLGQTFAGGRRAASVAAMAAAAACYAWTVKAHGGYGWLTLFNTSLISKTAYPAALQPSHAIGAYLRPYLTTAYSFTQQPHFAIYGLALVWLLVRRDTGTDERERRLCGAMCLVPLAFVALHLLLFPADTYRFFVATTALVGAWLIGRMGAGRVQAEASSVDDTSHPPTPIPGC
jgi:hypothetical protein